MELTRENVLNTLGKIIEPDLKNDLVSLNLIDELDLSANKISLQFKFRIRHFMQESACKKPSSST